MDASIPSKVDGVDFTATFRAGWASSDPQISRQQGYALAMDYLWKEAEPLTKQWYVLHHDAAQAAVNAVIDPMVKLDSAPISVTGHITLTASGQAVSATRDYLTLRRDEEFRRERTGAQLHELRRSLKSPGLAQLWWASNNPEHLAAIDSAAFANLIAAIANDRDSEISPKTAIEQVLLKFISEFTDTQDRQLLLQIFKLLLTKLDKPDLLKELD
jgi:hypothetical protein